MNEALPDPARVCFLPQRVRAAGHQEYPAEIRHGGRRPRILHFRKQGALHPAELGRLGGGEAHCVSQIDERGCVMARAIKRRAPGTPL